MYLNSNVLLKKQDPIYHIVASGYIVMGGDHLAWNQLGAADEKYDESFCIYF